MYKNRTELLKMVQKYLAGEATIEQEKFLEAYYYFFDKDADIISRLQVEEKKLLEEELESNIWHIVKKQEQKRVWPLWPRIAAVAASLIFVLGLGGYLFVKRTQQATQFQFAKNDIAPGRNTATLTLANGRKIILSDANKGIIAKETGVTITKTATGQIVYEEKNNTGDVNKINTLTTARGETYQVRLPDGTDVWLNAASSLKYPASFAAVSQRRVTLTGEAYFQVAKDKAHPFIVKTTQQEVQVLGTHFNINSYADEATTKTTLLEGSVQVTGLRDERKVLKPGEQSVLIANSIQIKDADTEEAVAWKNNEFLFSTDDFRTVMRKIARWYNIEVIYEQSAPVNLQLGGFSSRSRNISTVLKMMAKTGEVHFKVEGQKVYVSK